MVEDGVGLGFCSGSLGVVICPHSGKERTIV